MKEYKTIEEISGPLVFVEGVRGVAYGEIVEIILEDGEKRKLMRLNEVSAGQRLKTQ